MDAERPAGPSRRGALRLLAAGGIAAGLGGALVAELVRRGRLHRVSTTRPQMGTLVSVTVVHEEADAARALVAAAFDEVERLEDVLSRHRPATALSRLNREGGLARAPGPLLEVLDAALAHAERSDGAFDPTVAPLVDLWSSRFESAGHPPGPREIARARARVGWRALRLDGEAVTLDRPGMSVTLDGIAKGYVVDRAVAALTAAGAGRVMVDAGGDAASGGDGSDPWRVSVQHPRDHRGSLGLVELRGGAVATSGDYVQAYAQDRSAHHIVDPRTGRSPLEVAAVSVLAPTAMEADALSTSALVLGLDEGLALLEGLPGVEGLVVAKTGDTRTTRGFSRA